MEAKFTIGDQCIYTYTDGEFDIGEIVKVLPRSIRFKKQNGSIKHTYTDCLYSKEEFIDEYEQYQKIYSDLRKELKNISLSVDNKELSLTPKFNISDICIRLYKNGKYEIGKVLEISSDRYGTLIKYKCGDNKIDVIDDYQLFDLRKFASRHQILLEIFNQLKNKK